MSDLRMHSGSVAAVRPRQGRPGRGARALALLAGSVTVLSLGVVAAPAQAATGCSATYTVTNQWAGGFGADVVVKNLGDAKSTWTVGWQFPDGQTVTSGWNGTFSQQGAAVSVKPAGWNASLPMGGSVSFGFNGAWTSANRVPSAITLDGVTCTGSTTTTPTPTATSTPKPTTTSTPTPTPSPTGTVPSTGRAWSNTSDGFAQGTTGGAGGTTVTVTTLDDLKKYAAASGK
ncbi:cellulose-binding domain-containing protein [Cellulomonas sp. JH27-2]|uniref:cellulose-binding domain-containing protein n=1 Tax=Cellulomonas sp. JH27-2 TaxID=2774139 RepID=UPI001CD85453|nr:cellulose-binding domain-containing protein [Cellulomonas sp. JH27-2]